MLPAGRIASGQRMQHQRGVQWLSSVSSSRRYMVGISSEETILGNNTIGNGVKHEKPFFHASYIQEYSVASGHQAATRPQTMDNTSIFRGQRQIAHKTGRWECIRRPCLPAAPPQSGLVAPPLCIQHIPSYIFFLKLSRAPQRRRAPPAGSSTTTSIILVS